VGILQNGGNVAGYLWKWMKTDIARTAWDVEKSVRITTGMYPVEFCGAPQA